MKKRIVYFFVFAILMISYREKDNVVDPTEVKEEIKVEEKNKIIKVAYNNQTIKMDIEDYVMGVVACEVPATFNSEALKAMAVSARTFALYKLSKNSKYVMKTDTSDQCYISKDKMKKNWGKNFDTKYSKIKNAVDSTKNEYMTYKDKIIISFYFSISNGYTENCEKVFSQKLDYLVSVDSSWDKEYSYKEKTINYSISNFLKKLNIKDDKIVSIDIKRSNTGRIDKIVINNKSFKGTKFRTLLSLRSTDINITYDKEKVYIKTKGNGHGVGMSQYGANAMANNGYKYKEILKYYYSGIKITNKY